MQTPRGILVLPVEPVHTPHSLAPQVSKRSDLLRMGFGHLNVDLHKLLF
jgi:hypothetical protein